MTNSRSDMDKQSDADWDDYERLQKSGKDNDGYELTWEDIGYVSPREYSRETEDAYELEDKRRILTQQGIGAMSVIGKTGGLTDTRVGRTRFMHD